ncbi:hypothetical protein EZV62_021247 [Acer yangbiense]|uniref:Uncharacterized protein n=1 Tax=Acer yangbiense TaxID=1000413 RepID=A0A5C7H4Z1_9ROSI|nr:hypothetical protein EZV62_021247 [Acer yangbiense]
MAKYLKPLKMFEEGLKSTQYENTVFLGLNFGNKYVSMAISDDCYVSAFAYRVLLDTKAFWMIWYMKFKILGGGAPPGVIALWMRRSAPPWSKLLLDMDRSLLMEEGRLFCKECLLLYEERIARRGSPSTVELTFLIHHSQHDLIDASSAVHMLRANLDFFNALVGRESGEDADSEDSE